MLLADATMALTARRTGRAPSPRLRRTAVVLGIVAAEFPDADLVYSGAAVGMGNLGYLLHHRGHTHTVVWAVISAVVLWAIARWWWQRAPVEQENDRTADWSYLSRVLLGLATAGTLSHLVLDWTNSYGVHPFWPLDNRWYYGDAVFIVEPLLWAIAIPALVWSERAVAGRVILLLLLAGIVSASWYLGEVARPVDIVLTVWAVTWLVVQRVLRPSLRAAAGLGVWTACTLLFVLGASRARAAVITSMTASVTAPMSASTSASTTDSMPATHVVAESAVRDGVRDVVLSPAPGDLFCWSAVVVSTDGAQYAVRSARVAPFPGVRSAAACGQLYTYARFGADVLVPLVGATRERRLANSNAVEWRSVWSVAGTELAALAARQCEVAAALRFMRTPVWQPLADGRIRLSDARYGVTAASTPTLQGFAEIDVAQAPATCAITGRWVPPWTPPRADILDASPVAPSSP
jgi:inner membrane protein